MNNRLRFTLQAPLFWSLSLFLALLIGGPLFVIFSALGNPQPEIWEHLWSYVLPEAFVNTLWLLLGVGLGVLFLGISLAWITTQYSFPGHRFFAWALMLPLAIPGYVMATVYLRFLDYSGPVFVLIRSTWGNVNWHLPIQSVGGCIIVLVLALYPYVYLVTRNAFLTQGQQIMESAQMLGMKPLQAFFKGVIPAARPWWLAGLTLALMETVADFGTVSSFNYPTFTTAIYKIWVGMFNPIAALQLSAVLLGFVLILLMLKQFAEQGKFCSNRYFRSKQSLHGWRAWCATLWCALVWLLAFLFPIMQLLIWVAQSYTEVWTDRYIDFMTNSLVLAISSALILMVLGLCLALMDRYARGTLWRGMITIATLGYAIPGLVLGVGLIEPIYKAIALLNRQSPQVAQLLQDSLAILLIMLIVRFLAVAFQPIRSAMHRIGSAQEEVARTLGLSLCKVYQKVHWPLLYSGVFSAILLVFVEVMKEIPMTLMMRPLGWDTLAVRVFELTSEGMWEQAALPGFLIVLFSLLPTWLLIRKTEAR